MNIQVHTCRRSDELSADFAFSNSEYSPASCQNIMQDLVTLIDAFLANPQAQLGYWRKSFSEVSEGLTEKKSPGSRIQEKIALNPESLIWLIKWATGKGSQFDAAAASLLGVLLSRQSNKEKVALLQSTPEETLPFIVDVTDSTSFSSLIQSVTKSHQDAKGHRDTLLKEWLERIAAKIGVAIVYDNSRSGPRVDLELRIQTQAGNISMEFDADSKAFEASTLSRLAKQMAVLLEGIKSNPENPLSKIPLIEMKRREVRSS